MWVRGQGLGVMGGCCHAIACRNTWYYWHPQTTLEITILTLIKPIDSWYNVFSYPRAMPHMIPPRSAMEALVLLGGEGGGVRGVGGGVIPRYHTYSSTIYNVGDQLFQGKDLRAKGGSI